jgi:hypothetical protein
MQALGVALASPYDAAPDHWLRQPPEKTEEVCQTFCGT